MFCLHVCISTVWHACLVLSEARRLHWFLRVVIDSHELCGWVRGIKWGLTARATAALISEPSLQPRKTHSYVNIRNRIERTLFTTYKIPDFPFVSSFNKYACEHYIHSFFPLSFWYSFNCSVQADLKLSILWPQPPECWGSSCGPPCSVYTDVFMPTGLGFEYIIVAGRG